MAGRVEFVSAEGEQRYAALVRAAEGAVIGLDFDGTLSPIPTVGGSFAGAEKLVKRRR